MYLIQCEDDKSFCIVKDCEVICDEKVVKNGDTVCFLWKQKQYSGQIIKRSAKYEFLADEMKKLQRADRLKKKSNSPALNNSDIVSGKRIPKKRSFSPTGEERHELKKVKKNQKGKSEKESPIRDKTKIKSQTLKRSGKLTTHNISDSSTSTLSDFDNDSFAEKNSSSESPADHKNLSKSPTKDELKTMILQYQTLLDKNRNETTFAHDSDKQSSSKSMAYESLQKFPSATKAASLIQRYKDPEHPEQRSGDQFFDDKENTSYSDEDNEDKLERKKANDDSGPKTQIEREQEESHANQLFGPDYVGSKMIHLCDEIYCKQSVYKLSLGSSHKASHLARRLLEGVVKNETLLNCTMTGQTPRAQGKVRQAEKVLCLDAKARDAIIKFSMNMAHNNGWLIQTEKEVKQQMCQKLVELKAHAKKNAKDTK